MRVYTRAINGRNYTFRLSVLAQKEMEKKFKESAMQTVFGTMDNDLDKITYLLGAAAAHRGNENPVTDGEEIYDLLVDDGVSWPDGFFSVALEIAVASGILSEKAAESIRTAVDQSVSGVLDNLDEILEEGPTRAAAAEKQA